MRYEDSQLKVVAIEEHMAWICLRQFLFDHVRRSRKAFQVGKKDQTEDTSTKMVQEDPVKPRRNH